MTISASARASSSSKVEQLDQLVGAAEIELDEATIAYLEELYQPVDNLLSLGTS